MQNSSEIEEWRLVLGHEERYDVSSLGRVRNHLTGRLLSTYPAVNGEYLGVTLRLNGRSVIRLVHHLVLESFVGPRPQGKWGLHRDDCKTHNHPSNLYWGNRKNNAKDSLRNDKHVCGERHHNAKLTKIDAAEIRRRHGVGESGNQLARSFGVNKETIRLICIGRTWKEA